MTPSMETAESAVTHLENLLQHRLAGRVRELRLVLRKNGIVLQGQARTYHAKQVVQHAVMTAAKLPILANEIEVI
jgi:hypothetical protein